MDYLELAGGPVAEEIESVGPDCDYERMRRECRAFIEQLRRMHGQEPEGARYSVKRSEHDFGHYYETVLYFTSGNRASIDYAFKVEADLPEKWDKEALAQLPWQPKTN